MSTTAIAALVLRFIGRVSVPGLASGRRSLYSFTTGECASGTNW